MWFTTNSNLIFITLVLTLFTKILLDNPLTCRSLTIDRVFSFKEFSANRLNLLMASLSCFPLVALKRRTHGLKVHLCRFENLPTRLSSYKNNTLKISHS